LVFLVAGEPSGDILGARLMASLRHLTNGRIRFAGVGGPAMEGEGLSSLFPMAELSIMGLAEILPHIPHLLRRIRQTAAEVVACRPDVVVTIDSPGFNFRLAKRLKGGGIPLVHYVAPSVWVWRPGRARKIAPLFDHLLALLPFEPPYFDAVGLPEKLVEVRRRGDTRDVPARPFPHAGGPRELHRCRAGVVHACPGGASPLPPTPSAPHSL